MSSVLKEITAQWQGDCSFVAANAAGGKVQMGPLESKPGIGPMELLLAGLAGCTGMDIASILQKKRQPLVDLKVFVSGKLADEYPKVYTEIHVIYALWGDIDPDSVEQAIRLSEEKYCSVGIMLRETAAVTSEYHILQPGEMYEPFAKQEKIA